MSEYVKKQALLGFLDVSIEGVPCKHISIELLKEKIQSGAFDPKDDLDEIIRKNHSLAVKMKVRTLELEDEIQRLRAALEKARQYIVNGYELGYIDDREGYTETLVREIDKALSGAREGESE
jgi:hypothetical protein